MAESDHFHQRSSFWTFTANSIQFWWKILLWRNIHRSGSEFLTYWNVAFNGKKWPFVSKKAISGTHRKFYLVSMKYFTFTQHPQRGPHPQRGGGGGDIEGQMFRPHHFSGLTIMVFAYLLQKLYQGELHHFSEEVPNLSGEVQNISGEVQNISGQVPNSPHLLSKCGYG